MYKVLIAFNGFAEGQEIELKPLNGRELIAEGYVELIETIQDVEKSKRGRKPKEI